MAGKFELFKNKAGKFQFNLKAGNNQVVLSSEAYESIDAARNGIASVQANAPKNERFERKTAKDGQHYFVLTAANGQTIGKSEMYKAAASMENGIRSVTASADGAATVDSTAA